MNDPFVYPLKISSFFAKLREKIFSVEIREISVLQMSVGTLVSGVKS